MADSVRASFDQTELAALWHEADLGELERVLVAEEFAYGDAGAGLALLMPAMAARAARLVGASEVTYVMVGRRERVGWVPLRTGGAALQLDADGWAVVSLEVEATKGLGLLGAGCGRAVATALQEGDGATGAAIAELRRVAAAMLVGICRASLDYASRYVQEREAFGKRLADHQAVAFIVADMAIATEAARVLVRSDASAAAAWLEAMEAAALVTSFGVQLLGGHGYMKSHPVEKWMRDAKALSLLFGGADGATQQVVEELGTWT